MELNAQPPHDAHDQARVAEAPRPQAGRKAGPFILILCLVVAIAAVMFVPMFIGSASTQASSTVGSTSVSQPQAEGSYNTLADAAAALGFTPLVPAEVPEGYNLVAIRTLDGGALELEYQSGRSTILFRTAPGSDDLSGDNTEYAYTATVDDEDGVARSYAGASEQKLNLAVWAEGDNSFAVLAPAGLSEAEMHTITGSIG